MVDTTLTPAGRRVLAAAEDLFYREGIHAVGVDAIAAAAGVTKKTLYDRFGSKDRLVAAYLRSRDARWRAWLTGEVDQAAPEGRVRLLRTFDALAEWMHRVGPRGCAFVNALAELPDPAHPARVVLADQKRWLLDYLTELAGASDVARPEALAAQLLLLHEGAVVGYATGVPADAIGQARAAAAALIEVG
ncbi:MAG: TetR family transcriptional regulator [Micromonosporaceae bacterium]|nr:TetR family transcriptional regulator [Micromonosporaceae bacterium]